MASVKVFVDDQVPHYMRGIIRIGSVISEDENGNALHRHEDLVDNSEFSSNEEVVNHVAQALQVPKHVVEVVD